MQIGVGRPLRTDEHQGVHLVERKLKPYGEGLSQATHRIT
jgi:hypothetical protein